MSTEPKRTAGRPMLPEDQRQTERAEIRMTKAQRATYEALGGAQWVRAQLDRKAKKLAKL